MSKIEILDISFKKDLELLKLDVLDQITSKTDDFFTFNSSLEKKFEEIKEELSLIQNKTLLYQENHTEMMKTYHNEFNKYDKELNKYQLQLNNLQELLNHRYDKLQYNLDEQLKFTNISLSQLDKDITNKLTQLQQSNDANILNIQKDIETSNQTTENKLQLLSMQTQSDSQKMKESILKVLQDLFNEQFQLMNQKLSNQDKESNNNFNTMAEKLLEFSTALNFLEDEDHRLNETMTKNKELLQSELYTWKNKIWNELEGLQKNTKESQLETKYELSQLFNKLQILESRPSGNANPVNSANAIGGSGIGAMTMGNLLGGLGDDDGGGDQSFSYQHSFLYDPNNPYQGVQPNQPPEDRGGISSEQMMKLSSVVELSSTRIGQVETDIFNLQTEVKSLQNLKDQCKLLQDQMSNIGKMQAGFMELTKGLALQSSSNSNTPVDGVTIEMLLKAKNELKSEYNEQNRQLSVNLFEQEARVKEELKKLQEDFHKTIEIAQIGQKQEGGHTSGEIEKILSDWKSEHQSSYNQIAQRVQLLDQQVQEKDNQSTKQIGAVREELQKVFQQQLRSVENTVEAQKLQLHLIDENLAKLTVSAEEWKQLEKEIADITQNDIPATKTEISQSRTELELLQKEVKRLAEALVVAPSSIPATALSSSEIAETKEELQVLKKEVKRLAEAQVVAQSSILAPASAEIAETKEKVHLLQKEVKKIADAHLVAQSSIPAPTSSEIAETKEKLQVLQKEVSRLTEAHSENSTQLQNQRIDEDSTVQLLQTEIQALKEIYEKYKDAQTIQQEQMVNWKASLTEQFEERIQLLTQQEENNNNHQIHLMAALEEELKEMKELILVSQPSVPPPPPTKTPPLSPAKMASPMSAEVIENTVFTKLSQVMKNEISNLSNERNKQNEINLLTMHTKLQHSIEEKLQSLSSTLNETNKRSEVDRESFQHFQKEFNDAQLKEKIVQLREEWAKFLADSKSKDENFEERIGDVEFSQKQLTERLQSSLDSFQNKSNSLQEQMQVLQEEILSLSESKDDIPKLVSAAFVDQKDALLKSFLEEIKKFKPPTPAPPANTTPQASPKVPVNTDNSIKLTLASPSVTPNTSTSVKPVAEGASKVSVESKEVPIIAAPSKQGADSPKKTSTVTVEEKTATEPKLGLEKASSINTPPAVSTNKEIKVTSNITEPTVSSSTLVGPNTTNKNEEKPISERSVQEIANSMSVSPAVSPVKENVNKSGNFEESFINRSTSSDSISSGTGKPPLASPLTKKTSFSSSISKLNEKLGTTKPATQAELKTTPTASAAASPVKYSPADLKQVTLSSPIKTSDDKSLPSSLSTPSASSIDIGKTISTPERTVMSNDGSKLIPSEGAVISSSLTKIMTSPRPSTDNSAIIPNSAKTEAKSLVTPPSTPKKTDTPSSAVKAETTDKTNASLSSPKLIPAAAPPAQKQEAKEDKAESLKIASTASTPSREKTSSASSTPGENRRSSSILDKIAAFETKNITKDAAPASRATSSTEKVEFVVNKPPESDKTAKSDAKMDDIKPNTSSVPNQTPLRKKPELDDSFDAEDDENELSPASKGSSKLDASTSFLSPISSDTSPIKHSERKAVVPSVGRQRLQNDGDEEESNEIHLNFDQSSSHYLSEVSQTPPRKTVSSNQDSHEDRQDNEKRRRHLLSSLADDEEFVSSSEESSVMGKDDEHDDDEEDDDEEEGDDSFGSPRASSTLQGPPQSFVAGVSFPMVTTPDRGPVHRVNPISSTVPAPSPLNATVSNPLPPSTSAGSVNTAPLPPTATTSSNAPASTASSNVVLSGSLLGRSKK